SPESLLAQVQVSASPATTLFFRKQRNSLRCKGPYPTGYNKHPSFVHMASTSHILEGMLQFPQRYYRFWEISNVELHFPVPFNSSFKQEVRGQSKISWTH